MNLQGDWLTYMWKLVLLRTLNRSLHFSNGPCGSFRVACSRRYLAFRFNLLSRLYSSMRRTVWNHDARRPRRGNREQAGLIRRAWNTAGILDPSFISHTVNNLRKFFFPPAEFLPYPSETTFMDGSCSVDCCVTWSMHASTVHSTLSPWTVGLPVFGSFLYCWMLILARQSARSWLMGIWDRCLIQNIKKEGKRAKNSSCLGQRVRCYGSVTIHYTIYGMFLSIYRP